MRVLIGGGSGFIGSHLEKALRQRGHTVQLISRTKGPQRVTWDEIRTEQKLPECDALVNLSGEYILNPFRLWNASYKKDVYDSRICTNQLLVDVMSKSKFVFNYLFFIIFFFLIFFFVSVFLFFFVIFDFVMIVTFYGKRVIINVAFSKFASC